MAYKPKKLKIGFFTDTYVPQVNGVVTSINTFCENLKKLGHQVYIFAPTMPGYKDKKDKSKIFRFQSIKFTFHPEYRIALPFSYQAVQKIPKLKLDIIHSHTPFSLGILAEFVGRVAKIPIVHTYHTLYPEYVKSYIWGGKVITPKMAEKFSSAYCNHCDAVVAPSPKMEYLLKKYGVAKKIVVIPTGIKLEEFVAKKKNNFKKAYNIPKNAKVLVFVGRAAKEKNIEFIIKAYKKILKKIPKAHLLLVSGGPYQDELLELVKKINLQEKVSLSGYIKRPQVIRAYFASNLFVFASKTDTQGLVLLEAMACGLPVVAVSDRAFEGILENQKNGYTTGNNINDFANKVVDILTNSKKYNKMSQEACKTACQFTAKAQAEKLVELYQSLIKK